MKDQRTSINLEANDIVHQDRPESYGHPLDDFRKVATMWSAILGVKVHPHQVPLCMIAIKISRQTNKHKRDNLVDIAGYAETAQMVVDESLRRDNAREHFADMQPAALTAAGIVPAEFVDAQLAPTKNFTEGKEDE